MKLSDISGHNKTVQTPKSNTLGSIRNSPCIGTMGNQSKNNTSKDRKSFFTL